MRLVSSLILGLMILGIMGQDVFAMPVEGSISFSTPSPTPDAWDATGGSGPNDVSGATGIDFKAPAQVDAGSGTFAGTVGASPVNFNDFLFTPFTPGVLWSFMDGGVNYTLKMTSLTFLAKGSTSITLEGNGIFIVDGFDNTAGTWDLNLTGGNAIGNFSSTAVPEPAVAMLLGIGLVGVGVARSVRRDG